MEESDPVEDAMRPSSEGPSPWSVLRVLFESLLVAGLFLATQGFVLVAAAVVHTTQTPDLDAAEWSERAASDGLLLGLSSLATAVVCVPFLRLRVGRRESQPWRFLGLRLGGARETAAWVGAMAALVAACDMVTLAIGRPLVPDFMLEAYASSGHPVVLLAALVIAAPAFEETFFRGFLLSGLTAARVPATASALVSALAWSSIHLQYDLYDVATIFGMGLLLAAARFRTGSIVPCLAMHALVNAVAFTETAWVARPMAG